MKTKKNVLSKLVSLDIKARPHWITTENWVYVKSIISDFKELMVDKVLSPHEISTLEWYMNVQLNYLAENADHKQIYECHCFVTEILDFYLIMAQERELYETCQNIKNLVDLLCVKIAII